ncbi:Probable transposable element [Penicillium roqueforti FM164]|uniref:Probable transposable element n=1 Tax=Penicillium roqueforti (strain FM164) TaxID=1365484 RepID=W6QFR9_PENRF|nr:Probable transposable element [Penicillium roqueforti FM164]
MSHEINLQQEVKGTARARTATSFGSGAGTTTSQSYTPRVKREGTTSSSGLSAIEWETLMKEGRWFYCKEKGHMTFECPKKKANISIDICLPLWINRYRSETRIEKPERQNNRANRY